ncbi:MAG: hypothetical protein ACTSRA_22695, partial [Promethearchaeota archaeon]
FIRERAFNVRDPEASKDVAERIVSFQNIFVDWLAENEDNRFKIMYGEPQILFSKGFPELSISLKENEKWKFISIKVYDRKNESGRYIHKCTNSIIYFLSSYTLKHIRIYSDDVSLLQDINRLWKNL